MPSTGVASLPSLNWSTGFNPELFHRPRLSRMTPPLYPSRSARDVLRPPTSVPTFPLSRVARPSGPLRKARDFLPLGMNLRISLSLFFFHDYPFHGQVQHDLRYVSGILDDAPEGVRDDVDRVVGVQVLL